jgi:hypothetical protein
MEPAVARIVVADEGGKTTTYFICKTTPVVVKGRDAKLASYHSPAGRLASLPIGSEFSLPQSGKIVTVEVLERALLHPHSSVEQEWVVRLMLRVNLVGNWIDRSPTACPAGCDRRRCPPAETVLRN